MQTSHLRLLSALCKQAVTVLGQALHTVKDAVVEYGIRPSRVGIEVQNQCRRSNVNGGCDEKGRSSLCLQSGDRGRREDVKKRDVHWRWVNPSNDAVMSGSWSFEHWSTATMDRDLFWRSRGKLATCDEPSAKPVVPVCSVDLMVPRTDVT